MPLFNFEHSYAQLADDFHRPAPPSAVAQPHLFALNRALAEQLGIALGSETPAQLAEIFSGNQLADGAMPIAMNYAGHQFGNFNPQLGDGRAILLGEVVDQQDERWDIQLKGAGRTPYSRGGDGRSPLGPVMREYLVSEAMHALGVPTTRALAAVTSGEMVYRDIAEPGAVLTRVARSHIRIGTFEFFGRRRQDEQVKQLADYVIERHYPQLNDPSGNPYEALLEAISERQAALVAHWMSIGFIHGVMNTDNTCVTGDTIDYGPCAFMDHYHAEKVFSSIDQRGRYAYRNQPMIAQWNLARLAECLLPHFDGTEDAAIERASTILDQYSQHYLQHWRQRMGAKLGVANLPEAQQPLVDELLALMQQHKVDFTLLFRQLSRDAPQPGHSSDADDMFGGDQQFSAWRQRWASALDAAADTSAAVESRMKHSNPAVIPRNHRIAEAIKQAEDSEDFTLFKRLHARLAEPFSDHDDDEWLGPPAPEEQVLRTFCGT